MLKIKKSRLKKFSLHPITSFIVLILFVMILSSILSFLNIQSSYSKISSSNELESVVVTVDGLFNIEGFKYLISNAARNFVSFTPLSTLLMGLIGLSVAHASGLIDSLIKRKTLKIKNRTLTFLIIFVAAISSNINSFSSLDFFG